MRGLFLVAVALSGCAESHDRDDPSPTLDAATPDAVAVPDGGGCSCQSGHYRVTGHVAEYDLWVLECGRTTCRVDDDARTCYPSGDGVFRVHVDGPGYTQLIFSSRPCDGDWRGVWASEGAPSVPIRASRVP